MMASHFTSYLCVFRTIPHVLHQDWVTTAPLPVQESPAAISLSNITLSILGTLSHVILASFVLYIRSLQWYLFFFLILEFSRLGYFPPRCLYSFSNIDHFFPIWWTMSFWCLNYSLTLRLSFLSDTWILFFLFPRPMNSPPWREPRFCCLWPVKRATSTPLPPANSNPWSQVKQARPWSKRASTHRTHHHALTPPWTSAWVLRALRRRTSPTRCLSRRAWATQRWKSKSGKVCCCRPVSQAVKTKN